MGGRVGYSRVRLLARAERAIGADQNGADRHLAARGGSASAMAAAYGSKQYPLLDRPRDESMDI